MARTLTVWTCRLCGMSYPPRFPQEAVRNAAAAKAIHPHRPCSPKKKEQ